jgi:hypothetical protein
MFCFVVGCDFQDTHYCGFVDTYIYICGGLFNFGVSYSIMCSIG